LTRINFHPDSIPAGGYGFIRKTPYKRQGRQERQGHQENFCIDEKHPDSKGVFFNNLGVLGALGALGV
jgi:hypothetical protein